MPATEECKAKAGAARGACERGGAPAVEFAHGDAILASGGENVWNWSSPAAWTCLRNGVELFVDRFCLRQAHKRVREPCVRRRSLAAR